MPRKPRTVFAVDADGKRLFVRLEAVMHPWVALCDGLPVTFFGREKTAYLGIDTAIAWAETECRENPAWADTRPKGKGALTGRERLDALRVARDKFSRGEIEGSE
jgi:hypothetical protein